MGVLRVNKKALPEFIFFTLISDQFRTFIKELTQGVNINNLKGSDLMAFLLPLPSIEVQQKIVDEIKQENKYSDSAQLAVALFEQKIKSRLIELWDK